MPTTLQLERSIKKLQKQMVQVRETLGLYPPLEDPLKWDLKPLDKRVLNSLIEMPRGTRSTSTEIAAALGLENPSKTGRVYVWRAHTKGANKTLPCITKRFFVNEWRYLPKCMHALTTRLLGQDFQYSNQIKPFQLKRFDGDIG